jgi:hypothetical protein
MGITMGRNHEVTTVQDLLDRNGNIAECGWSRQQLQQYHRSQIRAPKYRIKEWDYYLVIGRGFGAAFTLSDDGYVGLQSVSLLDFEKPWEHTETVLDAFPMGKLHMPENSQGGDIRYHKGRLQLDYLLEPGKRHILCKFENFCDGKPFACDIFLHQPKMDTMVIATPWNKAGRFYFNQKINCMRAEGWIDYDGRRYCFDPQTDFGTLDWGRGVWTYDNTWLWGSGNCDLNGKPFGFNIGYGFGNTTAATENVLFYDGVVHKLDDVTFHIPDDDYLKPWTFTSSDGRFEMEFSPILDRSAKLDYKVILTDQHQVFGRMSGRAVLDDGTALAIKDVLCFAEKVHNKY